MDAVDTERTETIVDRLLAEIADLERCDELDLPPLYDAVDPDALVRLVDSAAGVRISFAYDDYRVEIETPDGVDVTPE